MSEKSFDAGKIESTIFRNGRVELLYLVSFPNEPAGTISPSNLSAVAGEDKVSLSWSHNGQTPPDSYNVYRDGLLLATGITSKSYTDPDSSVDVGTEYTYEVTAVKAGNETSPSNQSSATPYILAPDDPNLLVSATQMGVDWDKGGTVTPDAYNVYRDGVLIQSGVSGTMYTDTGLDEFTFYCYEITAIKDGTESPKSGEVCEQTSLKAPNIDVLTVDEQTIELQWSAGGDVAPDYYNLYRNGSLYLTSISQTLYNDTQLSGDTQYCYEVTAVKSNTESDKSNVECGTTEPETGTVTGYWVTSNDDRYVYGLQSDSIQNKLFYEGDADFNSGIQTVGIRSDGKVYLMWADNPNDEVYPVIMPKDLSSVENESNSPVPGLQGGSDIAIMPGGSMFSFGADTNSKRCKWDNDLSLLWSLPLQNKDGTDVFCVSVCADREGNSYWATRYYAGIVKLDPQGNELWHWEAGYGTDGGTQDYYSGQLALYGDYLYLTGGTHLYRVDPSDGSFIWEVEMNGNDVDVCDVATNGDVYVGISTSEVVHFDSTGTEQNRYSSGKSDSPEDIHVDKQSNVYITNNGGDDIDKLDSSLNNTFTVTPSIDGDITSFGFLHAEPGDSELTVADSTPPAAPTGLTVTSHTDSSISVDWDDNSESNLAGYNVYVDGVKDNSSLVTTSDYQVTGLSDSISYDIYVKAVDDVGNISDPSSTVTQETDNTAPSDPTGLSVSEGDQELTATWNSNPEEDLAGYNVYLDGVQQNSSLVTTTSYTFTGLTNGQQYTVGVEAVDQDGLTSNTTTATGTPASVTQTIEDFEDGDVAEWTDFSSGQWAAVQDRVYNGSYAGNINNGSYSGIDVAEYPVTADQYTRVAFYWQESSNSNGGGVEFLNSNGNVEFFLGTSNPDWDVRDASGYETVYLKNNANYDVWVYFEVTIDWGAGTFTFYGEDLNTGETFQNTYDLRNGVDIASIMVRDYSRPDFPEGSGIIMWFDDFLFEI